MILIDTTLPATFFFFFFFFFWSATLHQYSPLSLSLSLSLARSLAYSFTRLPALSYTHTLSLSLSLSLSRSLARLLVHSLARPLLHTHTHIHILPWQLCNVPVWLFFVVYLPSFQQRLCLQTLHPRGSMRTSTCTRRREAARTWRAWRRWRPNMNSPLPQIWRCTPILSAAWRKPPAPVRLNQQLQSSPIPILLDRRWSLLTWWNMAAPWMINQTRSSLLLIFAANWSRPWHSPAWHGERF